MATFSNGKVVHFGADGGRTYIDHGDKAKKDAYIARHGKNNEDWNNPYTAGALARWILWGDSISMNANVNVFKQHFGLN